jgi:predicted DNA-binding ribbon-helix-helix protein
MLIVQAVALVGLFLYCAETYKLRKASQRLVQTSMGQVEGLSKPCITFWAELRDGKEAILSMDGATGNLVARLDDRSYVIHNLGSGLALNLRYYITRNNPEFALATSMKPYSSIKASVAGSIVQRLR